MYGGETGGLEWRQETPNELLETSLDGADLIHRTGDANLGASAADATRLPGGHPEAFIEAFANVYRAAAAAIRAGRDDGAFFDYPNVSDGARGVRFINAVIGGSGQGWIEFDA